MKLFGKNPVIERIKSNPQSIRKIYIEEHHPDQGYITKKANKWGILVLVVPRSKVQKIARNTNHQGVVAEVASFAYEAYEELLEKAKNKKWTLVFLDGLTDPQNLGAIIRSLGCLGNFALVLPTHDSVHVTESVLRVACGGDNYVPVAQVKNLARAIKKAQELDFWITGTVVKDAESVFDHQFHFPCGVVIGSEQKGVSPTLQKALDYKLTIPMHNQRMSFNAGHATTIIAYEITKQKS